jgi:hypothetical protein
MTIETDQDVLMEQDLAVKGDTTLGDSTADATEVNGSLNVIASGTYGIQATNASATFSDPAIKAQHSTANGFNFAGLSTSGSTTFSVDEDGDTVVRGLVMRTAYQTVGAGDQITVVSGTMEIDAVTTVTLNASDPIAVGPANDGEYVTLLVRVGSSPITIPAGGTAVLAGGVDLTLNPFDTITMVYTGQEDGYWVETSRSIK